MNLNHSQAKPRACCKCGVVKIATKFHTDHRTKERYPHCIECGAQTTTMRTCTECKVTKPRNRDFGRTRTGTVYTYHNECKECRPAVARGEKERAKEARQREARLARSVAKETKTEASRAKALARIAEKDKFGWLKPAEKQVDYWPWKYNGMVYEGPHTNVDLQQ